MKKKKNNYLKIAVSALVIVLIVGYFICQAVMITDSYATEVAMHTEENEYFDTKAYIVRDEKYIKSSITGTRVTMAQNSERVKIGDTVCIVFGNAEAAESYTKIEELKKEISRYEQLAGQANLQTFDISSLNEQNRNRCTELMNVIDSGNLKALQYVVGTLRDGETSLQIATGKQLDFDDKLTALRTELDAVAASAFSYKTLKADRTGYYSSFTDGYENKLAVSDVKSVSAELLDSLLNAKPSAVPKNVSGKLIEGFKWYILCTVDNKYFGSVGDGETVYVDFPQEGVSRLPVKVCSFADKGADKTVLVLECSMMNETYTRLRVEDMRIIMGEHTGLKISSGAVRVVDGQQGVYVLIGNIVHFRKINVVYSTDNYVISGTPEDGADGYIRLYDEVILGGEDLYDGKLVG